MKMTAPQVAAIEIAGSLLGTTLYVLWQNSNRLGIEWDKLGISWDTFQKAYGLGLPVKPLDDVKDLQEQLKTLTEKSWTTRVEVQDMGILKEQIEELERAKRGLQGLGAADEATKERGQIVTEAVVEGGGRKRITDAVLAATAPPESAEVRATREKIEGYQRQLEEAEKAGLEEAANFARSMIDKLKATKEGTQAVEVRNRRTAVDRQLGLAGAGDEAQARWLRDIFEKNREKFEAQGVDMLRLGAGLTNAQDPMAEKRRKAEAESQEKAKETFEKRQTKDAEVEATVDEVERATSHAPLKDRAAQDERARVAEQEAEDLVRHIDAGTARGQGQGRDGETEAGQRAGPRLHGPGRGDHRPKSSRAGQSRPEHATRGRRPPGAQIEDRPRSPPIEPGPGHGP